MILILPIFIREGKNKLNQLNQCLGIKRYSIDKLTNNFKQVKKYKIPMVALFPYTS